LLFREYFFKLRKMENIWWLRAKAYYFLIKPRTVWLLVFVGLASAFLIFPDWQGKPFRFLVCFLALLLSVAGTNAVTCWIDRDIDKKMERTRKRPLPQGELTPRAALLFGLATFFLGCSISLYFEPGATIYLVLGFFFSAIIYNGYFKRRSSLNILFASPAGMMPILFCWSFLGKKITLTPLLLGLLVVFWTPAHIWSLAAFYASDYDRVKVPMLPLVVGREQTARLIALFNALLIGVSLGLGWVGFFGNFYRISSLFLNLTFLTLTFLTFHSPSRENSWRLFKFSSPYLAFLFLLMIIDRFLSF